MLARERLQEALRYKQESIERGWVQHIAWSTDRVNEMIEKEEKVLRLLMQLRGNATIEV